MKKIEGDWSGRITGTNNANIFVEFKQDSGDLRGAVRINDPVHGVAVYQFNGGISGSDLQLHLTPDPTFFNKPKTQEVVIDNRPIRITLPADHGHGKVTVNAKVINDRHIEGAWASTIGTGGNLFIDRTDNLSLKNRRKNAPVSRKSVFVSYAHADSKHLERLRVHLKPLEKDGVVEVWDDTKIKVGDKWEDEIEKALARSAIAVLVVSADFLASDFIINDELPPILSKAELDGTRIVPVILKPCRFARDEHLSKFQALNAPDKPILSISETEQEDLWDRLSQVIEEELNR